MLIEVARFTKNNGVVEGKSFRSVFGKRDNMMNVPIRTMVTSGTRIQKILPTSVTFISFQSEDNSSKNGIFRLTTDCGMVEGNSAFPVSVTRAFSSVFNGEGKFHSMFQTFRNIRESFFMTSNFDSKSVQKFMNQSFSAIKFLGNFVHRNVFVNIHFLEKFFCYINSFIGHITIRSFLKTKVNMVTMKIGLIRWNSSMRTIPSQAV